MLQLTGDITHTSNGSWTSFNSEAEEVFLDGDFQLIRERMAARPDHYMSPRMLESQLADLERPDPGETVVVDIRRSIEEIVAFLVMQLLEED